MVKCSFCDDEVQITMLSFTIATAKTPDPAFNCDGCLNSMRNLKYFESKLVEHGGTYIHQLTFTQKEKDIFLKDVKPLMNVIITK